MNSISNIAKEAVKITSQFLNQEGVKEGVKTIAGRVSFAFGLMAVYDTCQTLKGRAVSTEKYLSDSKSLQNAYKASVILAKISMILSASTTGPGVFIISKIAGSVFSAAQLNSAFGPNTIFAINPWHPRHVVSLLAVALALPSFAVSTYKFGKKFCQKLQKEQVCTTIQPQSRAWLTDSKFRMFLLFNTITSRPVLHIGNQLARAIIRR